VRPLDHEDLRWVIQPLADAGVGPADIRSLVFRLGFEGVVADGAVTVAGVDGIVADRPAPVRVAWAHVIGRLLVLQENVGSHHLPGPGTAATSSGARSVEP
jgi:hypothetical protein